MIALVRYEAACAALAECRTPADVMAIHRQAVAWVAEAKTADDLESEIKATVLQLRAERRLGQMLTARKAEKDAWIEAARTDFVPKDRADCKVCGKFKRFTQAHHLRPLARQFDQGFDRADHDHIWLCPTHHVMLHSLIHIHSAEHGSRAALRVLADTTQEEWAALVELLITAFGEVPG